MSQEQPTGPGRVYLVGAGPGAPGLITLRGVECLQRADVVLYDYLVNPRILRHAASDAQLVCLGRHGRTKIWPQEEINAKMVDLALSGQTVVRLKGGDPAIFARGAEELEALQRHDIPFEVVPGITAALAAGSCAGVPVTHRELASAAALVTGQESKGKEGRPVDYGYLAGFPGTLVVYMGVTTAATWTSELLSGGMPPETPAIIIRRCSLPDQSSVRCTVGQLTDHLVPATKIRPPVIVIVGQVAALEPASCWFERRPLFGRTVMETRPDHQGMELVDLFEEEGASVISQPAIEIRPVQDWTMVDDALDRLDQFDWVVFSSVNGVRILLDRLEATGRDMRALATTRLAAIGAATVDALQGYHLRADACPARYQAEDLAELLEEDAAGKRFLLVRASRGREVLAQRLSAAGAEVTQVVAYESVDVARPDQNAARLMREGKIDWVTVTSSAIARSLVAMFGDDLRNTRLVSISPLTSATLCSLGFEPAAEARESAMRAVVDAVCQR